jgi:phosphodiesterase/alkaline phosphatase D-like protein
MPGNFKYILTGLSPATTYYFRVSASSAGWSTNGQYSTFTTMAASVLSITTREASLITLSSAQLHAYINSIGSTPVIRAWFNFGTGPECGMSTPVLTYSSAGPVSAQISGLVADTGYYFQAVAQTPDGNKAYGKQGTFKTASIPKAAVITYPATAVTDSSATLNGKLDNLGSTASLQVWFEYGTTADLGNVTIVRTFDSAVPFSSAIPILPGTTYYYRAVALSSATGGGTVSGATVSFVAAALPIPPLVSPVTSPNDWFIYCQRFVTIEVEKILKSLNINFSK